MMNCILFDNGDLALESNESDHILIVPWWFLTQITGKGLKWGEKKMAKIAIQISEVKAIL